MSRLVNYDDIDTNTFVELISTNSIVVYEEIQGSPIYVKWTGDKILIKPRNLNNSPLNKIDLAIQKYYGPAFEYFEQLSSRIKSLMPKNWWFEFEYFFDSKPAHVEYDKTPKNGLVLTGIIKGKNRTWNINEINEYANLFDVEPIPILFNGKLNDKQIEIIKYYINTSPEDLEYVFGENNFTYFFYKILNPAIQNSVLMSTGTFQENAEKIIIKIPSKKQEINFTILNPLYVQNVEDDTKKTEFVETYSIILLNFLESSQLLNLNKLKIISTKKQDMYLEMICILFNNWINQTKASFQNFNFIIPKFFKEDKYKVNLASIPNKQTKKYIKNDEKMEYAFRSILGSFQKTRKKPVGTFTQTSLELFNNMVFNIEEALELRLKLHKDKILRNKDLVNFDNFAQVSFDTDAAGEVYPDVYSKAEEHGSSKKKGKYVQLLKK